MARDTGGLALLTADAKGLHDIYGKIATELTQRYTLGYVSKNMNRDGV